MQKLNKCSQFSNGYTNIGNEFSSMGSMLRSEFIKHSRFIVLKLRLFLHLSDISHVSVTVDEEHIVTKLPMAVILFIEYGAFFLLFIHKIDCACVLSMFHS